MQTFWLNIEFEIDMWLFTKQQKYNYKQYNMKGNMWFLTLSQCSMNVLGSVERALLALLMKSSTRRLKDLCFILILFPFFGGEVWR